MPAVYRYCTVRCVLQLLVTRCCLPITTSPNSVVKPWTVLSWNFNSCFLFHAGIYNSISQFKTKQIEGIWDKCNVKAVTVFVKSKDNPSVQVNWESKHWKEQTDSRQMLLNGPGTNNFLRRFEGCLTVHLPHEITWNANLMQLGNFINVFLARHVAGIYAHH